MQVTNRMNLPEAIVAAVTREEHNVPGTVSATTLLKGVREILLTRRHWGEAVVDAADNIWAIFGTAVHSILESQNGSDFKEESFSARVSDTVVTGKVDSYNLEKGEIVDYKTASIWKVKFADFSDWHKQGMIYAWLLQQKGLPVNRVRFIALLKDHSKSKARHDKEYPASPVYVYEFTPAIGDYEEIEAFISGKVRDIEACAKFNDYELPFCTVDDRWADGDKYAVMKTGRKSAVRVLDSLADANEMAKTLMGGHYVEQRKGGSRKCPDYCICADFCSQWKAEQGDS